MASRGKFIAIEGIDGSGKRTQIDLLSRVLETREVPHVRYSFPRYESSFGRLVARHLNGEFGRLDTVDAHLQLFAPFLDRAVPCLGWKLGLNHTDYRGYLPGI